MVVVQPLAEQVEVRLVFPDGDGLDAAEKLAELEVGFPFGYMAVEVAVHGLWGGIGGWVGRNQKVSISIHVFVLVI